MGCDCLACVVAGGVVWGSVGERGRAAGFAKGMSTMLEFGSEMTIIRYAKNAIETRKRLIRTNGIT